jgi:hypothetical protein
MNRRIAAVLALAVLVTALGVSPALAQKESPLRFGVKLGMNISDFRGNDVGWKADLIDWKVGFCGGAFMSYAVNDWFTLEPELLYSMKGMKLGFLTFNGLTFSLDYIEIPVLAMAKIPVKPNFKPFVYAGPVVGFNVRSKISSNILDTDIDIDLSDYVSGTEFSLALGGGLNVFVGGQEFVLDFRYEPGLTGVFKDAVDKQGESLKWYNDTISILVGYAF